ncbi:MAG: hypothetical protein NZ841_07920 [Dictyoglomus sp.]|nr:hypothetical protein [Dictyoglomus sp.]MDW8189207.1 hypothetical protein [Dictyoglomus sp.]
MRRKRKIKKPVRRGKPKAYPEHFVLGLLLFKISQGLSFRELERIAIREIEGRNLQIM